VTLDVASAAFVEGYRLGRRHEQRAESAALLDALAARDLAERPFAFEGAAMAQEIRDAQDGGNRMGDLLARSGPEWRTFLLLGVGCAQARLGRAAPTDPIALDGYGFQLGLREGISGIGTARTSPLAERGRGRALWFVTGGDGAACAAAIQRAEAAVAGELWRGVGTACAFAGDPRAHAEVLPSLAGEFSEQLRFGVGRGIELWHGLGGALPPRTVAVGDAVLPGWARRLSGDGWLASSACAPDPRTITWQPARLDG